ncbi:MAG: hypothetical protein MUP55_03870 [Candidatus Aenigmarchaeota archaeon]|nr:hypothetical protein [Candidatus Aenigmarchaeota archaeon]
MTNGFVSGMLGGMLMGEHGGGGGGVSYPVKKPTPEEKFELRGKCKEMLENPTEDDLRWIVKECPSDESVRASEILMDKYPKNDNLFLIADELREDTGKRAIDLLFKKGMTKDENTKMLDVCGNGRDDTCMLKAIDNILSKPSELEYPDVYGMFYTLANRRRYTSDSDPEMYNEYGRRMNKLCDAAISALRTDDELLALMDMYGKHISHSTCVDKVKEKLKSRGKWGLLGYKR